MARIIIGRFTDDLRAKDAVERIRTLTGEEPVITKRAPGSHFPSSLVEFTSRERTIDKISYVTAVVGLLAFGALMIGIGQLGKLAISFPIAFTVWAMMATTLIYGELIYPRMRRRSVTFNLNELGSELTVLTDQPIAVETEMEAAGADEVIVRRAA